MVLVKGYVHLSYVVSRLPYGSRASRGRKRDVYCTGLFTTAPQTAYALIGGCWVCDIRCGGWSQKPRGLGVTGSETKKSESPRENETCFPSFPRKGGPRKCCPFLVGIGRGELPYSAELVTLAGASSPYPGLGYVSASDIFPAYVYSLARRYLSARVFVLRIQCLRARSRQHVPAHPVH